MVDLDRNAIFVPHVLKESQPTGIHGLPPRFALKIRNVETNLFFSFFLACISLFWPCLQQLARFSFCSPAPPPESTVCPQLRQSAYYLLRPSTANLSLYAVTGVVSPSSEISFDQASQSTLSSPENAMSESGTSATSASHMRGLSQNADEVFFFLVLALQISLSSSPVGSCFNIAVR